MTVKSNLSILFLSSLYIIPYFINLHVEKIMLITMRNMIYVNELETYRL